MEPNTAPPTGLVAECRETAGGDELFYDNRVDTDVCQIAITADTDASAQLAWHENPKDAVLIHVIRLRRIIKTGKWLIEARDALKTHHEIICRFVKRFCDAARDEDKYGTKPGANSFARSLCDEPTAFDKMVFLVSLFIGGQKGLGDNGAALYIDDTRQKTVLITTICKAFDTYLLSLRKGTIDDFSFAHFVEHAKTSNVSNQFISLLKDETKQALITCYVKELALYGHLTCEITHQIPKAAELWFKFLGLNSGQVQDIMSSHKQYNAPSQEKRSKVTSSDEVNEDDVLNRAVANLRTFVNDTMSGRQGRASTNSPKIEEHNQKYIAKKTFHIMYPTRVSEKEEPVPAWLIREQEKPAAEEKGKE